MMSNQVRVAVEADRDMASAMRVVMSSFSLLRSVDPATRRAMMRRVVAGDVSASELVDVLLTCEGDAQITALVASNPHFHTCAVAERILDYLDDSSRSLPVTRAWSLASAAMMAIRSTSRPCPSLVFRAAKAMIHALRDMGHCDKAEELLADTAEAVQRTPSRRFRAAMVTYLRASIRDSQRRTEEAADLFAQAIRELDAAGDYEKAVSARLYLIHAYWTKGDYVAALAGYITAAKRALRNHDDAAAATEIFNAGLCYAHMKRNHKARRYFGLAWRKFGKVGDALAAAKMMRCEARMAIRDGNSRGVQRALAARNAFERLGRAGEALWSVVDTVAELREYCPSYDVTPLCQIGLQRALALRMPTATVELMQAMVESATARTLTVEMARNIAEKVDTSFTCDVGTQQLDIAN